MNNDQLSIFSEQKQRKTTQKVLQRGRVATLVAASNLLKFGSLRCHEIENDLGGASELYRPHVVKKVEDAIRREIIPAVEKVAQLWADEAQATRKAYQERVKSKQNEEISNEILALEKKYGVKLQIQK